MQVKWGVGCRVWGVGCGGVRFGVLGRDAGYKCRLKMAHTSLRSTYVQVVC